MAQGGQGRVLLQGGAVRGREGAWDGEAGEAAEKQEKQRGEGEGWGQATLTGLMSRCRKPTEWMASMDSRICLPSRRVVLSVKVPLGWLRRRSARFRPWW